MDVYAHAADVVRACDPDRYIADLFAPEPARKHLFALHAFAAEVARVREVTREPVTGEIRLQWWRDALGTGDAAGHPVAAAALATIKEFALPAAAFDRLIQARIFDLYDDPMPTMNDLEGYAGETASALYQIGAVVLAGGRDVGAADAAGHAGVAETLVGVLRSIGRAPAVAAKYIPQVLLQKHGVDRGEIARRSVRPEILSLFGELRSRARNQLAQANAVAARFAPEVAPAFLPLAVTAAKLDRAEWNAANPFLAPVLPRWRRQLIIWKAARRLPKVR